MKKTVFCLTVISLFIASSQAKISDEAEVSIIQTGGNTNLATYSAKNHLGYKKEKNIFGLGTDYMYGESDDIRNQEKWNILGKFERELNAKLNGIFSQNMEANRFSGIRRRYNTDLGAKYFFIKTDKNTSFVEGGYRYTKEKTITEMGDKSESYSKARLYAETSHQFNKSVSAKLWMEYIPNFDEGEDYLLNIEPSLTTVLTSILSFKTSYTWNYDNLPSTGKAKADYTLKVSLVAKF